jgi:biotin carboxyl carrier protein
VVLIISAITIRAVGLAVKKASTGKSETAEEQKKGGQKLAQENVDFPIPGKVLSVNFSQGSAIKEGDVICTLESMKMENPIVAPCSGTITKMELSAGQVVEAGQLVCTIES